VLKIKNELLLQYRSIAKYNQDQKLAMITCGMLGVLGQKTTVAAKAFITTALLKLLWRNSLYQFTKSLKNSVT
jgi:hypothetical protein